jgi:hypothetical protein
MPDDPATTKLLGTTDSREWAHVVSLAIKFKTDHPQGLLRIGDLYYLSSVRFTKNAEGHPDTSTVGQGFLIKIEVNVNESTVEETDRIEFSDGAAYHPGGMATDGKIIYIPVSEYRPDSSCHVYKVDAETFEVMGEPFVFPDHLGALSIDRERERIFGMSWSARKIYVWDYQWNLLYMNQNPIENVNYQDIDFVGGNTLACSGFSTFELGGEQVEVGGIDLIDASTWLPYHRIMVTTRTDTGRLLTHNAFTHRLRYPDLFLAIVPDDDEATHIEVYRL